MITVNDEQRPYVPGFTVQQLLQELDPTMPIAVVRIDGEHIAKRSWGEREIRDGEQVRVVYIIAGG